MNTITVKNHYLLPLISELINKLKMVKYLTKLDIHWGYNNICLIESNEWKAAFHTNNGLFKPLVIFFRLSNSPAIFQMKMNHLFYDLINYGKVIIYMDDIMTYTKTLEEHCTVVHKVLQILHNNKLYLKHEKCKFEALKTEYLGLVVFQNVVKMDPAKVLPFMTDQSPHQRRTSMVFLGSSTSIIALLRISLNLLVLSMH